ncbi:polysaccharide pyruvyl transferase family protein [Serratia sp. L9]|uniref:polysaccharide pyruvyl transferase family protein n=1 Tax=Serratia sp. L9 TaxID=3423946 RepID=UPI003D66FE2E
MDFKYVVNSRLGLNKFIKSEVKNDLVSIFDTSISSLNVGDSIINDSARKELRKIFPLKQFVTYPTHIGLSSKGIFLHNNCYRSFVCGTNILNSNMLLNKQWDIDIIDALRMKPLILMGCGWGSYQKKPNAYTKKLLNLLLSKDHLHSVRDSYTLKMLQRLGIKNVINTSCPTMWALTKDAMKMVPTKKSNSVVFTLTDYRKDYENDNFLIAFLLNNYDSVSYWVQGSDDLKYLQSLGDFKDIKIIPPNLGSYDAFVSNNSCDFVGTRLHAGIRALQNNRRTLIIGVDNRAEEKRRILICR